MMQFILLVRNYFKVKVHVRLRVDYPRGADVMENLSPQQRAQLEMNQVGLGRTLREERSRRL